MNIFDESTFSVVITVAAIFGLRVLGVGAGTVRVLLITRGEQFWSLVLGAVEVLVYVLAIGAVVQDLSNIPNLAAYIGGFLAGTIVGMHIERKMAIGYITLRAVSVARGRDVAAALHEAGFGATLTWGEGRYGPVGVITAVIPRRQSGRASAIIRSVDPGAFIVSDETRRVEAGWFASTPAPAVRLATTPVAGSPAQQPPLAAVASAPVDERDGLILAPCDLPIR
ncbi:MAG: hypothetical protein Kow0010_22000 [Dehalococcoidia bacterium]